MAYNANDYRASLIEIKTYANLALKHLESVKSGELPEDPEFGQIFWVLLCGLTDAAHHLDKEFAKLDLPGAFPQCEDTVE
jgi:hypothetical protein